MKLEYLKEEIEVKQEKINEALRYIEMLEEEDSEESYIYNPEADEWGIESEKEQMSLPLSTREMELDPDPVHAVPPPRPRKRGEPAAYAENWFKGNKDQLLFETLMKKWAK